MRNNPKAPKALNDSKGLLTIPVHALLKTFGIGKEPAFQALEKDQKQLANLLYHARYPESRERRGIKDLGKIKPMLDYLLRAAGTVLTFSAAGLITFPPISITIATTIALSLISVVLLEVFMHVFYSLKEHNRIKTMVSHGILSLDPQQQILSLDPQQQHDTVLGKLIRINPTIDKTQFLALIHDINNQAESKYEEKTAKNICEAIQEVKQEIKSILFQAKDNNLTPLQKHLASKVGSQQRYYPDMEISANLDNTLASTVTAHSELVTGTHHDVWQRYIERREQAVHMQKIIKKLHDKRSKHSIRKLIEEPELARLVEEPLPTNQNQRFNTLYAIMRELENTIAKYAEPETIAVGPTPPARRNPLSSKELTSTNHTPSHARQPSFLSNTTSQPQDHNRAKTKPA